MSKKKKKKQQKKQNTKEHDSWFYAVWSLIIDTFFSFTRTGTDAGDLEPVFDASGKLGKKGKKRQNSLVFILWIIFCIIMIIISLSLKSANPKDGPILAGIFGFLLVLSFILRKVLK